MLASQVRHLFTAFEKQQQPAAVPSTKTATTVREEKLAGNSPRRKRKDRKVEAKAKKQGRRKKGAKSGNDADDEAEDDDVHMNRLKVSTVVILARRHFPGADAPLLRHESGTPLRRCYTS